MKLGIIIFCLSYFVSSNAQNLDGDWIYSHEKGEVYTFHVGFSIKGDSLFEITYMGMFEGVRYQLDNGLFSYIDSNGIKMNYKFLQKQDTLVLTSNSGSKIKYYARRLEFDANLRFDKIVFEGPIYGSDFDKVIISINRKGKGLFVGQNTLGTDRKKFKVDKKTMNKMDSLFKWSFIKSTDNEVMPESNFESPFTMTIDYNKDQQATITGTATLMPYRIRLIHYYILHELYVRKWL